MKDPFRFDGFVAAEARDYAKITIKLSHIVAVAPHGSNESQVFLDSGAAFIIKVGYKDLRDKLTGVEGDHY